MTTYNIASIRSAISALLSAITTISEVHSYMAAQLTNYPAIIFELDNEDAEMLDTTNNTRILTFKLWIVVEVANEGISAASALLDGVTKDVINVLELQSNSTLSGNADWVMPVMGKRDQVASPEGSLMYQELLFKVYVASTIL